MPALNSQKGFAPIIGLLLILGLGVAGYTGVNSILNSGTNAQGKILKDEKFSKGEVTQTATDRLLVKFRKGIAQERKEEIYKKYGLSKKSTIKGADVEVLSVPGNAAKQFAEKLKKDDASAVLFAETDSLVSPSFVPNDPYFTNEWHMGKLKAGEAWDRTKAGSVILGICDTGFDASHPDLASVYLTNLGKNTVDETTNWSPVYPHGTSVAGTAAATVNNGIGVAGIAYDAKVIPVRISNYSDGGAWWSDAAECISYSADNGAKAINLSYRMADSNTIEQAALYAETKGAVTVVAAGNDGADMGWADFPGFLAVSATDSNDNKASFSSFGNYVDVAAPGVSILTAYGASGYAYVNGTSFAAPATTGVLGLMFGAKPDLTPAEAKSILAQTSDDIGPAGEDVYFGAGRINALNAVTRILGAAPSPTPTASASATPMPSASATASASASPTSAPTSEPTLSPTPVPTGDTTPPSVSIDSPPYDSVVSGIVTITALANDNVGVTKVDFYINGVYVSSDMESPYTANWDTTPYSDNLRHIILAKAFDGAGNSGTSSNYYLINRDITPPVTTFIDPVDGGNVAARKNYQIKTDITDNTRVTQANFLVNDRVVCIVHAPPFNCNWVVPPKKGVSYTLKVNALDGRSNQSIKAITVTAR